MHAAKNGRKGAYAGRVQALRGSLRHWMRKDLREVSGDKSAAMHWTMKTYHKYVYVRRRAQLVGWPKTLPFKNLSKLNKSVLLALQRRWREKTLRFVRITEDEAMKNARHPERVVPGRCEQGPPLICRNDIKKSRFDKTTGEPVSKKRRLRIKGATTPKVIDQDVE
ncbi:hypothetical protein BV20DRAFT_1116465 [Pilatotrama ljubarskyi]|nr:hypothetical protein BV20DRAFT_1116465 [Pilatotrama ljubarskyi]